MTTAPGSLYISTRQRLPTLAVVILAFFAAGFFGLLVGLGGPKVGIALVAAILGSAAFLLPITAVFWILIVMTYFVAGPIQYFGNVHKMFWMPYLLGLLLLLRALAAHLFVKAGTYSSNHKSHLNLGFLLLYLIFALTLFASSLINQSSFMQVLLSLKEYFFLTGAGLVVAWGLVRPNLVDRVFQLSHWWLLVQLPVIFYQHYFIAVNRVGSSPWDTIVGLMGGNQNVAGGASASMALCVIIVLTYHLSALRAGLCRPSKFLIVFVLGMASIILAEVKVAALLLPLAFALVYLKEIIQRPLFGLTFLAMTAALGGTVLLSYQLQYTDPRTDAGSSIRAYVEQVVTRNTEDDNINMTTGEMGRVTAFKFWAANHTIDNPLHLILGHGIGASRIGIVAGDVAKRFRFTLSRSSTIVLLWEGGLLATFVLTLLLLLGSATAFRRSSVAGFTQDSVMQKTAGVGLLLCLILMPYGSDLISVSQSQLLAVLLLARTLKPASDTPGQV